MKQALPVALLLLAIFAGGVIFFGTRAQAGPTQADMTSVLRSYRAFVISVYEPNCAKHKGLASLSLPNSRKAYPTPYVCKDGYRNTQWGP